MDFLSPLTDLYENAGSYGDPILIATLALMLVGSAMLFVVRIVKRFILYTVIALLLPNSIGVVGYVDQLDEVHEAIVEHGETMANEAVEAVEDREWSTISFGLLGSALAASIGLIGIVRLLMRKRPATSS
jgi:hypothetical protein